MSFFGGVKRTGSAIFLGMPKAILGVSALRIGNSFVADAYRSLVNPRCPQCANGVMRAAIQDAVNETAQGESNYLILWKCHSCAYGIFGPPELKKARDQAIGLRAAAFKERLSAMEQRQFLDIARSHRNHSRSYYAAAIGAWLGAGYMIASGASWMTVLNWAVIGFAVGTVGLTRAYRAWQAATGTFFVEGAFLQWLRTERWFV